MGKKKKKKIKCMYVCKYNNKDGTFMYNERTIVVEGKSGGPKPKANLGISS